MNNFLAHILVVDDDEGIRSLVKKYLNENQYLVNTANNAEDAFEKNLVKHDLYLVDKNDWHQLKNPSKEPCHIIEIQYGDETLETDIERLNEG